MRIQFLALMPLITLIGSLAIAGCGRTAVDGRPNPVPVSGTITYKSKPVDGAKVVFAPQDHAFASVGQTDAQGRFKLQTFEPGDGAVVGKYKVVVSKFEAVDLPGGGFKETFFLPQRYRDPEQSGLEATVPEGGTDQIVIELND